MKNNVKEDNKEFESPLQSVAQSSHNHYLTNGIADLSWDASVLSQAWNSNEEKFKNY